MLLTVLIFSFLSCFSLSIQYTFSSLQGQSKLISWKDSNGVINQILFAQLQVVQKTSLVKRLALPYTFMVDESCEVTQSLQQATIFEPHASSHVKFEYIHLKGNEIISKSVVDFNKNTTINLNQDLTIHVTSLQQDPEQKTQSTKSLYIYAHESLISFDPQLFSYQPSCYMLSPMSPQLCKTQQCFSLSPKQLFDMEIGTQIKNYSLLNDQIILPHQQNQNLTVSFKLQFLNPLDTQDSLNLKQQQITISEESLITVEFQFSQSPKTRNVSASQNLRGSTQLQSTEKSVEVIIKLTNIHTNYVVKNVKLLKGEQLIESFLVFFKPLEKISYKIVWKSDETGIPTVEIYSENMVLESRHVMSNFIDWQYNQEQQKKKDPVSPNQIQTEALQELTTTENHSQSNFLTIILSAVGGLSLLVLSAIFIFRKRIFSCCYGSQKSQQNEKKAQTQVAKKVQKQNQAQKQQQNQLQSSKNLRQAQEFTFQKKQSLFTQTPSAVSKIQKNKSQIQIDNPEDVENKNQCSLQQQLGQNEHQQKFTNKNLPSTLDSLADSKLNHQNPSDKSLSINSNYSKSYTAKQLTTKKQQKEQQEEETQNI